MDNEPYDIETGTRHLMARWHAEMEAERLRQLREDELFRRAMLLLSAGVTLIPCDHLKDNEFVVSRELYEAAKRAA